MNEILQSAIDEAKRNAESVHSGWSCTLLAYVEEVEAAALDARNAREMYKRGNTQIIIERERYREALAQTECLVASHEAVIDRLREDLRDARQDAAWYKARAERDEAGPESERKRRAIQRALDDLGEEL